MHLKSRRRHFRSFNRRELKGISIKKNFKEVKDIK